MSSYIRMFNAAPEAKSVDVYANGYLVESNLGYKSVSQYFSVVPGNYNFIVYPAGQKTNALLNTNLEIPEGMIFNIGIVPSPPVIGLYPLPEPERAQNFGRACIRFVNLSPSLPAVDVTLPDGSKIFKSVNYEEFTSYACIPPGRYNFQLWTAEGQKFTGNIPEMQLDENKYYTLYTVGNFKGSPALSTVLLQEPR